MLYSCCDIGDAVSLCLCLFPFFSFVYCCLDDMLSLLGLSDYGSLIYSCVTLIILYLSWLSIFFSILLYIIVEVLLYKPHSTFFASIFKSSDFKQFRQCNIFLCTVHSMVIHFCDMLLFYDDTVYSELTVYPWNVWQFVIIFFIEYTGYLLQRFKFWRCLTFRTVTVYKK